MSLEVLSADAETLQMSAAPRSAEFVLVRIAVADPEIEYCLQLAHQNMNPYLARRGEQFSDVRWRKLAPHAEFFLIVDNVHASSETVGFVSVRPEPDCPPALHIGDVQVEAVHHNRGAGSAALRQIENLARSRGLTELTLNVFRDNPALRLYERCGFQLIDTQFYKYKMRKTLTDSTF